MSYDAYSDMSEIVTADGLVRKVGDRVFNYYDMYWVKIGRIDHSGWFDTTRDDGTRGAILNGERVATYDPRTRS